MGTDPPPSPHYKKLQQQGIDVMLQNLPQLLAAEEAARQSTDPQRIEDQQALQAKYGPIQTQQQLDQLRQIDPTGQAVREQLGQQVGSDLASGYKLPADFASELETQIRGSQAARGNTLGNASGSAEALYKGKAALDLYQRHQDNAGQFLGLQTPEQQINLLSSVSPDRSFAYVNPTAGNDAASFGLQNYQNLLAQNQLTQGSPWTRALSGAATGAAAGSAGGTWGTIIGGAAGAVGGYFSDSGLKENIIDIGKSASGIRKVMFNYIGDSVKRIGALAQDVIRINPGAVGLGLLDGRVFATVDYEMIDVPFMEV